MNEVIFTTSSEDAVVSVNVWDSNTCTNLMSYRGGGVINSKALSLLGYDYLIGAEKNKPILQVWPINSQQTLHTPRLLCPGKVSVISCSPEGCYIAIAVDEKLHIYQVSSGCLLGSGIRHFQAINVIKWSYDGSILGCGGEDGMVTVWSLSGLLNKESHQNSSDPRYVFNDHTLPVSDLFITCGGSSCYRCRLLSVSVDRTCKLYDIATGKILLSIIFPEMLTSVTMTPSEMEIFVGCTSGDVNQLSLRNPKNINSEIHVGAGLSTGDEEPMNVFKGHSKSVTCLSVSIDGERLLSGSHDESIRIWHIMSKQCLKVLNLKGPVTNAFFTIAPKQMLEQDVKRQIVIRPFQKSQSLTDENNEYCLEIVNYEYLDVSFYDIDNSDATVINSNRYSINGLNDKDDVDEISMKDEIKRLRSINERLYKTSVQSLLSNRINDNEDVDHDESSSNDDSKLINKKTSEIIENIFDNLISYQKQPKLNQIDKKRKKKNVPVDNKDEDINLLCLKSPKKKKKKKKRKLSNSKSVENN